VFIFFDYFTDKICKLKQVVDRDKSVYRMLVPTYHSHSGPVFDFITSVSTIEVTRIISAIPAKSSPLDFIPTSLLKSCCGVLPI